MTRIAVDFPLCNDRLTVLQYCETVQLTLYQDGWPEGSRKVVGNLFCGPETAQELRAIADHIEALFPVENPSAQAELQA